MFGGKWKPTFFFFFWRKVATAAKISTLIPHARDKNRRRRTRRIRVLTWRTNDSGISFLQTKRSPSLVPVIPPPSDHFQTMVAIRYSGKTYNTPYTQIVFRWTEYCLRLYPPDPTTIRPIGKRVFAQFCRRDDYFCVFRFQADELRRR